VLTAFQERIELLVFSLPEADGFVLAGGAALVVWQIVDRPTEDLDFFTVDAAGVSRLRAALEERLRLTGMSVDVLRAGATFVRYRLADADEGVLIDLAQAARRRPPVSSAVGPTLDPRELAADKVLALWHRAEARDFIDVAALAER
jgi:predicted nucleotidyltransferase component of viral defense system